MILRIPGGWSGPGDPFAGCPPVTGPGYARDPFVDIPWKTLHQKDRFPFPYFAIFAHAK